MTISARPRTSAPRPDREALGRLALTIFGLATTLPLLPQPAAAQIRGVVVDDPRPGQRAPALVLPESRAAGAAGEEGPVPPYDLSRELGRVVVLVFCQRLAEERCSGAWQELARTSGGFPDNVSVVGITGDPPGQAAEQARVLATGGRLLTDDRLAVSRRWGAGASGRVAVFVVGALGVVGYRDLQFSLSEPEDLDRLRQAVTGAASTPGRW